MFSIDIKIIDHIDMINSDGNELFISDGYHLIRKSNNESAIFMSMINYYGFVIENNGLWLNYGIDSEKSGTAIFVDIYKKNKSYPELKTGASFKYYFNDENIIGAKPGYLFDILKKDGSLRQHKGSFNLGVVIKNNKIYAVEMDDGLICYDMDFNEIWRAPFESDCLTYLFDGPQNFENVIIVNIGENDNAEFELKAYSADDGTLVWQVILETSPHSSNVIGDKVYISVDDRIMIIDATTGKTLLEKPHLFKGNTHHLMYPYKNLLIVISEPDSKIHIFDQEGSLKQQITMPDGYMPSHVGFPVEYGGNLFIDLSLKNMLMRGTSSVLLTLIPDETAPETVNIELPLRPPFYISVVTTKQDDHEHVITISHENLDEIILYAIITLKEIGKETSDSVDMTNRDAKHNGALRLFVDPEPLEGETDLPEKLQIIKEKVEWYLKSHYYTAGVNENDYKVVIELK